MQFRGFSLARTQLFKDVLYNFQDYLILTSTERTMLLIPKGEILSDDDDARIFIEKAPTKLDVKRKFFTFHIHHRFRTLCGSLILSRLHLAAIHAAASCNTFFVYTSCGFCFQLSISGTLLPEDRTRKTGEEKAMILMRQCWTNQPLQAAEHEKVHNFSSSSLLMKESVDHFLPIRD